MTHNFKAAYADYDTFAVSTDTVEAIKEALRIMAQVQDGKAKVLYASDTEELLTRLKAACIGAPYAKIPWPHRLLHDAIAMLAAAPKVGE